MSRALDGLRYAARMLLKTPGASLTVFVALSLGIALPGLMFGLIRGAVLAELPVENGERIVRIGRAAQAPVTAADYDGWAARQRSLDGLAALRATTVTLGIDGRGVTPVSGAEIQPEVLPLLSVEPALGRAFTAEDATPGAPAVVLIGYDVWRDRLDTDPGALGRTVRVNGRPAEIVGIMPEGFGFPWNEQVWSPLEVDPLAGIDPIRGEDSGSVSFLVGRLREGVSARAAAEDLSALTAEMDLEQRGVVDASSQVHVRPYTDLFGEPGVSVVLAVFLLGVALMVLLVACANIANVLLARTVARSREVAIRTAIGASRARIAGQFLGEVSLLAAAGAAGGLTIVSVASRIAVTQLDGVGEPFWVDFGMDPWITGFVVLVAALSALVAGLVPALQASRADANDLLKEGARGASGFRLGRTMRRLIGVEMALSFVLLVGAGLFVRSALEYYAVTFDFEPEEVYAARLLVPDATYGTPDAVARFQEELRATLDGLGEVEAVALASAVPGVGSATARTLVVEGAPEPAVDARPRVRSIAVSPEFFALFRAPILAGRGLAAGDRAGALPVAVVSPSLARGHFPEGALGRRIRLDGPEGEGAWLTIVGVTTDLMAGGLEGELDRAVYVPLAQDPRPAFYVLARPVTDFASLPGPIREAVAAADPDVPLADARSHRQMIDLANQQYAWFSALFLLAGGIGLFLAGLGLYGVMAFWVAQRTREIGVRMALGGQRGQILGLVLRQGMAQVAIGLGVGLALAIPFARLLGAALYQVSAYDPVVFVTIPAILLGAAWLGCWVPARRATGIDPLEALSQD